MERIFVERVSVRSTGVDSKAIHFPVSQTVLFEEPARAGSSAINTRSGVPLQTDVHSRRDNVLRVNPGTTVATRRSDSFLASNKSRFFTTKVAVVSGDR